MNNKLKNEYRQSDRGINFCVRGTPTWVSYRQPNAGTYLKYPAVIAFLARMTKVNAGARGRAKAGTVEVVDR